MSLRRVIVPKNVRISTSKGFRFAAQSAEIDDSLKEGVVRILSLPTILMAELESSEDIPSWFGTLRLCLRDSLAIGVVCEKRLSALEAAGRVEFCFDGDFVGENDSQHLSLKMIVFAPGRGRRKLFEFLIRTHLNGFLMQSPDITIGL